MALDYVWIMNLRAEYWFLESLKTWKKRAFIWLEPADMTIIQVCNDAFQDDIHSFGDLTI